MTSFHNAMKGIQSTGGSDMTANGAVSYGTADISGVYEGRLAWFFKGIRGVNFVYAADFLKDTFCLVFNTRDVLKGKGERALGRKALQWLLINYPEDTRKVIELIPEYGRWDDLYSLFPRVLTLDDLAWVNSNFCSNVSQKTLSTAREVQNYVVSVFRNQLQRDWTDYQADKPITLAAKWCETEGSGDDRRFGLVQQICADWKLHPKGYRVRVGEMRTALNIVEKLCAGKRWGEIDYSKVPSQTMKKLRKAFGKNDEGRFKEWLSKLHKKDPTVKVNAKTLHPHELVTEYLKNASSWGSGFDTREIPLDPVIEAQWKAIEDNVRAQGMLEKTVVVSDMSGSMYSGCSQTRPIDVCIALSLLIARTSKHPWSNGVIPFSESPAFYTLARAQTLKDMIRGLMEIEQGFNTNFLKVFQNILERHDRYKLKPEDHPDRIIVISDMQFDAADRNTTNLQAIDLLYSQHPQKLKRPTLIFWNVNSGLDFPATTNDQNLCLIGGFSPSIMTALSTTKNFSPACVMREVIDGDRYNPIRKALKTVGDETAVANQSASTM
jgi:hypothetical protein